MYVPRRRKFLIFETFKHLMTLLKINISKSIKYNGALYIGIDIRRMRFLETIIFKMYK